MSTDIMHVKSDGTLTYHDKVYTCALGKNGVTSDKKEGDGASPIGCFPLREIYYRADRLSAQSWALPTKEIIPGSGWGEDPNDTRYNRYLEKAPNDSEEHFWREDHLYDIIVVIGYNDEPPIPGNGSAIFMHIARDGYSGTAGCIALSKPDLLELLTNITPQTTICIES